MAFAGGWRAGALVVALEDVEVGFSWRWGFRGARSGVVVAARALGGCWGPRGCLGQRQLELCNESLDHSEYILPIGR